MEFIQHPEVPPSIAPYSYRKEKETHVLIFSWLSWLAVLFVGDERQSHTIYSAKLQILGWQRPAVLVYHSFLWYWTSVLSSIDTCRKKLYAESRDHIMSSSSQLMEVTCFLKFTTEQVLIFAWIMGLCQVNLLKAGQDCSKALQR